MDKKRPLKNTELTAMLVTGGLLLLIGLIVWAVNTDFDYDPNGFSSYSETNPEGQFIGTALGASGLMLLTIGWAAAVICRQMVDLAARSKD